VRTSRRRIFSGFEEMRQFIKDNSCPEPYSGCWFWMKSVNPQGYGSTSHHGWLVKAHRFSFEAFNERELGSLLACHKCDNPSCVNPGHLFAGTVSDNTRDMILKFRRPRNLVTVGEIKPRKQQSRASTVTEPDVISIRKRYSEGKVYMRELAAEYGVTKKCIHAIVRRITWKHLP